jgi:hypothetical protein
VAGKVDAFLKVSMGLALLIAAGSIGYYYAVYLPTRDAQLDSERRLERAHAEFARKTAEERAQAEREAIEQRQVLEKAAAQDKYESCIDRAGTVYNANWTLNCKNLADKARKDRTSCTLPPATCDSMYPARDPTVTCALPQNLASAINADLERSKDRCLQEIKAGLQ